MGKLRTVELGRGLAAAAVVLFHTNTVAGGIGLATSPVFIPFQFGVDFFFVLSGFIIFYVHKGDIGHKESLRAYTLKRLIRLFPVLWLVAGGWMVLRTVAGAAPDAETVGTTLLLYPSLAKPIPVVVWTLRHEIIFYAAFVVAILNRKAGVALFALWLAGVLAQMILIASGRPLEGVPALVLSPYVFDFALGAALAFGAERWKVRSWWPLAIGVALVLAYGWATLNFQITRLDVDDYTSPGNLYLPLGGLAFTMLLYGLLCIEDLVRVPNWAMLMGAASYSIYLVHAPVNAFSQFVAGRLGNGLGHLLIFAAGMIAGVVLHLFFEKPVTGALRRALLHKRPATAPAGVTPT